MKSKDKGLISIAKTPGGYSLGLSNLIEPPTKYVWNYENDNTCYISSPTVTFTSTPTKTLTAISTPACAPTYLPTVMKSARGTYKETHSPRLTR